MSPLERIKLVGELHKKINERNAEKDPIKKIALTNEVLELQKILVSDILKRTSHITIVVGTKEDKKKGDR